jgi:hypothetical protein
MERGPTTMSSHSAPEVVLSHTPSAVPAVRADSRDVTRQMEFRECLLLDGQSALSLSMFYDLVHIRVLGVEDSATKNVLLVQLSGCAPTHRCIADGSLWLFSDGDFIAHEFSCVDWVGRSAVSLGHLISAGERLKDAFVVPGTQIVWIVTGGDHADTTRVISLDDGRVLQEFEEPYNCEVIPGTRPGKIFRSDGDYPRGIFNADGSAALTLDVPPTNYISYLTVGPRGEGFQAINSWLENIRFHQRREQVVFDDLGKAQTSLDDFHVTAGRRGEVSLATDAPFKNAPVRVYELVVFDDLGKALSRAPISDHGCEIQQMATLPAEGCLLVQTHNDKTGGNHLWSYVHAADRLELDRKRSVPQGRLIQDPSATATVYVRLTKQGDVRIEAVPWSTAFKPGSRIRRRKAHN